MCAALPYAARRAECILDGSVDPAVMRCARCKRTRTVALPRSLKDLVDDSNDFAAKHRYCHLTLFQLRANETSLKERLAALPPNHKAYDDLRGDLYAVQDTILAFETDSSKCPQ